MREVRFEKLNYRAWKARTRRLKLSSNAYNDRQRSVRRLVDPAGRGRGVQPWHERERIGNPNP